MNLYEQKFNITAIALSFVIHTLILGIEFYRSNLRILALYYNCI